MGATRVRVVVFSDGCLFPGGMCCELFGTGLDEGVPTGLAGLRTSRRVVLFPAESGPWHAGRGVHRLYLHRFLAMGS